MKKSQQPTILITGGTGFAGSHLVEALLDKGFKQIHVTHFASKSGHVHSLLPSSQLHSLDLTDQKACFTLFEKLKPDQVYHLAALAAVGSSFDKTRQVLENNLQLQLNVLEATHKYSPQARILVVGSSMEYDLVKNSVGQVKENHPLGPASPYAVSKVLQDMLGAAYVHSHQLDIVRARPFNHIGERQTPQFAVPAFAKQIVAIEQGAASEIKVGSLTAVRDFSDVKDIVQAYITLMEKGHTGEVYNIGSGQGYSMQQILDLLIKNSSAKVEVITDPTKLRPIDVPKVVADNNKIKQLGWQPTTDLTKTIKRILEYWRQQP